MALAPRAVAEGQGGPPAVKSDWGCWKQEVESLCSSPGSFPDCALGLTP